MYTCEPLYEILNKSHLSNCKRHLRMSIPYTQIEQKCKAYIQTKYLRPALLQ